MSHNYFTAVVSINASDADIRSAVMENCGDEWNGESVCFMYEKIAPMPVKRLRGCYTENEADEAAYENDDFYWGQYIKAVPFCKATNKKTADLDRRIRETEDKYEKYLSEHRLAHHKAAFIGCPECQSKIARPYFERNINTCRIDKCPVCGADMASETTKKTLQGYKAKIKQLEKEKEAEIKKFAKKPTHYLAIAGVHS